MTSRRNTGLTTNRAPASITRRAVSPSRTVPAPSTTPGGSDAASCRMSSIAPRYRHRDLDHPDAARPDGIEDRANLLGVFHPDDRDDPRALDFLDHCTALFSHKSPPASLPPASTLALRPA